MRNRSIRINFTKKYTYSLFSAYSRNARMTHYFSKAFFYPALFIHKRSEMNECEMARGK